MTSKVDDMNVEIRKLDFNIAILDRDIEKRERLLSAARQKRERLWRRRATLQSQLEREDTVLVKPTGPCVTLEAHDGVEWDV